MSKILNPFKYLSIHDQIFPQICYIFIFRNHKNDKIIVCHNVVTDTGMELHVNCHP